MWLHAHSGRIWHTHSVPYSIFWIQSTSSSTELGAFIYIYKVMTNLHSVLTSRDITLLTKVHTVKAMVFPAVMYKSESWTIKKAEPWRIDAFELWCWRRFESPLDSKEIKPVNPEWNQPWIFIGRTGAEAPILWPSERKSWLIGKDLEAGKDWREEEERTTEDETVGQRHRRNGHESEQTGRWWRTGKHGMLQSMGSQRVGHALVTQQQSCVIC